jgi:hypothetical protein
MANPTMTAESSKLKAGDWVEVRSKDEILNTLDKDGRLEGMPFMPEMFAFCGKRFQVYKRAHKTCDTVNPVRGRRVEHSVHLETRCDGSAHGGCQATCLLFWKDGWLKPVNEGTQEPIAKPTPVLALPSPNSASSVCTEFNVWNKTIDSTQQGPAPVYVCQATRLPYATSELNWWDIRQYIEDYSSGNVGVWRIICGITYFLYLGVSKVNNRLGCRMRQFYDMVHPIWGGSPFPRKTGTIPDDQPTPTGSLGLQPGELVKIKPYEEILQTLNTRSRNRGLYFDAEEVPYCGGTYRVLKQVTRIINERTGRMQEMKTPCFILDSVICQSRYSECRLFCPRSIYSYWREIWLERVGAIPPARAQEDSEQAQSHSEYASIAR